MAGMRQYQKQSVRALTLMHEAKGKIAMRISANDIVIDEAF
jgi:hypothetical protein